MLVVQDQVPEYRRPFFERLHSVLEADSIRLTVAVGSEPRNSPAGLHALPFVRNVSGRDVSIAGYRLGLKRLSELHLKPELVIVEQALRHLETYALLLRQRRGAKVALWGHGVRVVKPAAALDRLLERRVTSAAHWFFAYTDGSASAVEAMGFPRDRVTVVRNTIDVERLASIRDAVSSDEQASIRGQLDIPQQNVCLFVGELDAPKRMGFLLDACSIVASRLPEFALIVAGDGPQRRLVERSLPSFPWLRYVDWADDTQKARLGAVSDVLLMPGRVGLVAVDSFALRTPIVTTAWPHHAPEIEYLEEGVNARISDNDVTSFARAVELLLSSREELAALTAGCAASALRYSMDSMVTNFADGVAAALESPRR